MFHSALAIVMTLVAPGDNIIGTHNRVEWLNAKVLALYVCTGQMTFRMTLINLHRLLYPMDCDGISGMMVKKQDRNPVLETTYSPSQGPFLQQKMISAAKWKRKRWFY